MIKWAKSGASAAAELEKHEKEQAIKAAQNRKLWRFWVAEGTEGKITFIDGNLTADNTLDFWLYYEHNLMLNGEWGNTFVCTKEVEPCPICAAGDSPSLVGAFTVIDHSEYKSKKGDIYKDTQKLFVAKQGTLRQLQIIAVKRGGLAGCTFDVMRTGDKSPSVGNMFDFVEKQDIDVLKKKYTKVDPETKKTVTIFVPANYEKECAFLSAAELRETIPSLAAVAVPTGNVTSAQKAALEDNL